MPVIQYIKIYWRALSTVLTIIRYIKHQKNFIEKYIEPDLVKAKSVNDGSIEHDDLNKIMRYYGLAVPAIIGEAICVLRNKKMSSHERLVSTYQGAITGLGDDFFDKKRLSESELFHFINNPQEAQGNTELEKIALHFYKSALSKSQNPSALINQILKVFESQLESKKQTKPGLSFQEIKEITFLKGGQSLLFYRTAFEQPLLHGEQDVLNKLGGVMQLSNDIFDVYKDQMNGIQTLVTTTPNIRTVRKIYDEILNEGIQNALHLNYNKNNIRKFLEILSIAIFSRCYVCLNQLEENEKESDDVFRPDLYTRKNLVCDMDTTANKIKSIQFHAYICRKFM